MSKYHLFRMGLFILQNKVFDTFEENEVLKRIVEKSHVGTFKSPVEVVDFHEITDDGEGYERIDGELSGDREGLVVWRNLFGANEVHVELG